MTGQYPPPGVTLGATAAAECCPRAPKGPGSAAREGHVVTFMVVVYGRRSVSNDRRHFGSLSDSIFVNMKAVSGC